MVQVGREPEECLDVSRSNTLRNWAKIEEIVRELAVETNEKKLTILTHQLLDALGEDELLDYR